MTLIDVPSHGLISFVTFFCWLPPNILPRLRAYHTIAGCCSARASSVQQCSVTASSQLPPRPGPGGSQVAKRTHPTRSGIGHPAVCQRNDLGRPPPLSHSAHQTPPTDRPRPCACTLQCVTHRTVHATAADLGIQWSFFFLSKVFRFSY